MYTIWRAMGLLRNLLHILAVLLLLVLPFSEPSWNPRGWALLLDAVIPALVPILFVVLMFDTLMSSVMRSDTTDEKEKVRLTFVMRFQLLLGGLLVATWIWVVGDALYL